MQKKIVWFSVIAIIIIIGMRNPDYLNEEQLSKDYYDFIDVVSDLFKNHTQTEEKYFNQSISSKDEITKLLDGKVTEDGYKEVVYGLFEKHNDLYVYKEEYQDYLRGSNRFFGSEDENTYYNTVKNSIINPALRLINFDQLNVRLEDNRVIVEGEGVPVRFYDDEQSEYYPYARYGYPPKDYINVSLTFIYQDGKYLLDDYRVSSIEL